MRSKILPKPLGAPALPNAGQRGMVGQGFVQAVTGEPADREIDLRLAHQPPVVDDAKQKAREHQAHRRLGIDAGPPVIRLYSSATSRAATPGRAPDRRGPERDRQEEARVAIRRQIARAGSVPSAPAFSRPVQSRPKLLGTESQRPSFFNSPTRHLCHVALSTRLMELRKPSCASGDPSDSSAPNMMP